MPHFYPKHLPDFPYIGKLSYALEFTTENRALLLKEDAAIDLVVQQFLRTATETGFAIVTYCLMPDHAHLVVDGAGLDDSISTREPSEGWARW